MTNDPEVLSTENLEAGEQSDDRREAIKKLGKYAAYVAPFTVMALSAKAASTSGTAGKGGAPQAARR